MTEADISGGLTLEKSHLTVHEPPSHLYPDVFVGKLRPEDRQALAEGKPVTGIKLGGGEQTNIQIELTEGVIEGLRAEFMKRADDAFILIWEGDKIPRGAEINGYQIIWTQNGVVQSHDGEIIGVYDRLMEYGGPSHKEQQMLVFCIAAPKNSATPVPQK